MPFGIGQLQEQGDFATSLASLKKGHELGSRRAPTGRHPPPGWVDETEQLAILDNKLQKFLRDEILPERAGECVALAKLCQKYKKLYKCSAVRFTGKLSPLTSAFADDMETRHRYNAACAPPSLAGRGQGKDAAHLKAEEYARLRGQSLAWLRADLAAWRLEFNKNTERASAEIRNGMRYWQQDPDFNGVRGAEALAKLPEAERQEWQALWQEVEELARRAGAPK